MTYRYKAEVYEQDRINNWNTLWSKSWFCREFAQRDINSIVKQRSFTTTPLTVRVMGTNMRSRTLIEQDGMAKFASILLPDYSTSVDSISIWFNSISCEDSHQIYPVKEVYSLMLFYIKYLSVQMKDRVDFDKLCKTLIKRKHTVFRGIPDQQLGTALYFFTHVRYPKEMQLFDNFLGSGNGPGTAMRRLADLEEATVGNPIEAGKFYYAMLDEWCSLFKKELQYTIDYHIHDYERFWYLPLLVQDVYTRVYDGDGKFDGMEYGDDEW